MPFESQSRTVRRIAVIGGGISGLAAAQQLAPQHAVVLFEAERRLGGHARTVMAGKRGDQPVDTGFIVFNRATYPNLSRMFDDLNVPVAESNMSFGVSIGGGWLEYGLASLDALFARRANVLQSRYARMLLDILKFNRLAERTIQPQMTLRDLLGELGTSAWFQDYYITPFTGAIWSTPVQGVLDFPAWPMVRFFRNHGLLGIRAQHQWYTVKGGSVEYVRRMGDALARNGVELRTGSPVAGVRRVPNGVLVRAHGGEWELFDDVILATHSDQSLAMLSDATATERKALSAIRYQANEAVLHSDARLMPRSRRAWSSWNYVEAPGQRPDKIALTYWMNSLQPIPADDPLFVTLNPVGLIDPACVMDRVTFQHPVFDLGVLGAQDSLRAVNGQGGTWFAGAWMGNGFHEDGFASALAVTQAMQLRHGMQQAA